MTTYKGYNISHDCPPIPVDWFDYSFTKEDNEGEPVDGTGSSEQECKDQIDGLEG